MKISALFFFFDCLPTTVFGNLNWISNVLKLGMALVHQEKLKLCSWLCLNCRHSWILWHGVGSRIASVWQRRSVSFCHRLTSSKQCLSSHQPNPLEINPETPCSAKSTRTPSAEMEGWEMAGGDWRCWCGLGCPRWLFWWKEGSIQLPTVFAFGGLLSSVCSSSLPAAVRSTAMRRGRAWQANGRTEELLAANGGGTGKTRAA